MIRSFAIFIGLLSNAAFADSVTIAVASNFLPTGRLIADTFTKETKIEVDFVTGATGKLFTQIEQGAPYDVFMAADEQRPQKLVDTGFAEPSTLYTYAHGQLVLVGESGHPSEIKAWLSGVRSEKLAIANPKIAPYGSAAMQVLKKLKIETKLEKNLVYGISIAQTYQFIESGNAKMGFVPLSMVKESGMHQDRWQIVEPTLYEPIKQAAVVLANAKNKVNGLAWIKFLKKDSAAVIIEKSGYSVLKKAVN